MIILLYKCLLIINIVKTGKMGIFQFLIEAGFIKSEKGPVVISALSDLVERLEVSRKTFAIVPGKLVPEAREEDYDPNAFADNYMPFSLESNVKTEIKGIHQILKEAGFKESTKGPIVVSGLAEVIEGFEVSRCPIAILPGYLVPETRPESYPKGPFDDNYVIFRPNPTQ